MSLTTAWKHQVQRHRNLTRWLGCICSGVDELWQSGFPFLAQSTTVAAKVTTSPWCGRRSRIAVAATGLCRTSRSCRALAAFPMIFAVVFLCSKVGRVTGQGLFSVIKDYYSKLLLWLLLVIAVIGNVIEAGADMGGMAAALNLLMPISPRELALCITSVVLILQLVGSYELIRSVFRWLALTLLAYLGSALLAHPATLPTLKGTFIPTLHLRRDFMLMLVAVLGTTPSAPHSTSHNLSAGVTRVA
jgi:Natural resistance-associated macrophage protein